MLKNLREKMNKKWLVIGLAVATLVIVWAINSRVGAKSEKLETATVARKDLTQTVSASGKVKAQEQVDLKFQTSGSLTWVGVKEGDAVKKWQAVAKLDTRELQKTLEKYLIDYSEQRNDFEEAWRVTYGGKRPEQALTDTVKRILEKNQWDLEKAVLDVELKDIALKLATLITPIEGVVTHIDTPYAGINITPATAVFSIANPKVMLFEANIDEADAAKVKEGQEAIIALDAFPEQKFQGKIIKINFEAVTTKGGGTAFPTEVVLPENQDLQFKIGMNGEMEILTAKKENVMVIPSEAIYSKNERSYVRVLENNKVSEVEIKTGLETDQETEVLEGLTPGQKIITSEKK